LYPAIFLLFDHFPSPIDFKPGALVSRLISGEIGFCGEGKRVRIPAAPKQKSRSEKIRGA
jgi:hypothetical protein